MALLENGAVLRRHEVDAQFNHSERLFPLLAYLLDEAGKSWREVTLIGVGTGPGHFNGVRIGVAAARGLSLALGIPAVGVNHFDALAHNLPHPHVVVAPTRGSLICARQSDADLPFRCSIHDLIGLMDSGMFVSGHMCKEIAAASGAIAVVQRIPLAVAIATIAGERALGAVSPPSPYYMEAPLAKPARP